MSIAMKVTFVYLVIVVGSLGLSGLLTDRAIGNYVLDSTKASLISDGKEVIHSYELYGDVVGDQGTKSSYHMRSELTIAAQQIQREYVVIDPNGKILWNTFSHTDFNMLSDFQNLVAGALHGHLTSGVYPLDHPIYEFVAIPFTYTSDIPIGAVRLGFPRILRLPDLTGESNQNMKVVALFAQVSDLQRVTSQIWLAVAQGLVIASFITAVVGVLLARRLMKPASMLRKVIERVRRRDFSRIPVVKTGDEWEDFTEAFGDMVQSLQIFDEGQKRFLQNASHELKTPLMAIRGYAEGLRDEMFGPDEASRILDIIAEESVRIKQLVDQLIYLSKLETLEDVYTFTRQDLGAIIERAIERIHPLAKERHVSILQDTPMDRVVVCVDRDKMIQALLNLISNAIRHARRQILIRLALQDMICMIVEDDGDGFAAEDADRVFERFYHGAKGETGLGLPIAKAIVEKHRGLIYAENSEAGGARFVIQIPPFNSVDKYSGSLL